jgi:hypothetical protein
MRVRVRVERVVLEGMPLDAPGVVRFRAALEGELRRLLVARGVPAAWRSGGARREAPAAAVALAPQMPPAHLGVAVARSVLPGAGADTSARASTSATGHGGRR